MYVLFVDFYIISLYSEKKENPGGDKSKRKIKGGNGEPRETKRGGPLRPRDIKKNRCIEKKKEM